MLRHRPAPVPPSTPASLVPVDLPSLFIRLQSAVDMLDLVTRIHERRTFNPARMVEWMASLEIRIGVICQDLQVLALERHAADRAATTTAA